MRVVGFEGTAHTLGVGVIELPEDGSPRDVRVLANVRDMHRPDEGGIHPREAANHHARVAGPVLRAALEEAALSPGDVDLVAFSRSPGLGPCLRTVATAARAFALAHDRPIVGVNHCVAHLEVGRAVTPAEDPVLLYASGGNTQVIAYTGGRYRVIGETLDVGVGNMLDKFARGLGMPFPGGPGIEKLAEGGRDLIDLPYSVKGMDMAFSGILTTANARLPDHRVEDVCLSIQETAFAMLTEVTERALAHTEKDEVVLGGGVACNARLQEMVATMCRERAARSFAPENGLLVDNGVMIALLGAIQHRAGVRQRLEDTTVDQRERTDQVDVTWRTEPARRARPTDHVYVGAEAVVTAGAFLDRPAVVKDRVPKSYRHPALDRRLRHHRARFEAKTLADARAAGVPTPVVYDVDGPRLVMERVEGPQLKDTPDLPRLCDLGVLVARLHARHLVHGDLTTSNVLTRADELVLIDFGLAQATEEDEPKGTDLHVLREALGATHPDPATAFAAFMDGYRAGGGTKAVESVVADIERRGRYRGT